MLVSIALCTYNGSQYLAEQIDSLINQSYPELEIVVVDDCSTDNTYELLLAYAAKYNHFKVFKNAVNLGFTKNFERAIKLCAGELIALCDQDDIWDSRKIEKQVNAISNNIFVYHDSEFIHEDGTSMNKKMSDVINLYRGDRPETFLFFNCVSGHSILMKRVLIEEALPLKEGYFHDWWMAYVATNIGSIDYIPECLVKYRQHENSDTNILRLSRKKDNYKANSAQQLQRTLDWLRHCLTYNKIKHREFVYRLYNAYAKRLNGYISFEFATLLFQKRELLFFIQKKSRKSKLNYIYKQVWGIKAKQLFRNTFKRKTITL